MLRGAGGGSGWLENGWKVPWVAARKIAQQGKGSAGASRGERFEWDFEGVTGSIKTIHELGSVVNIAGYQLA